MKTKWISFPSKFVQFVSLPPLALWLKKFTDSSQFKVFQGISSPGIFLFMRTGKETVKFCSFPIGARTALSAHVQSSVRAAVDKAAPSPIRTSSRSYWSLRFGAFLELGCWNLELPPTALFPRELLR